MPTGDEWTRQKNRRARARTLLAARTHWPTQCQAQTSPNCVGTLRPTDPWILGHIQSRQDRPDLMWNPTNWRVECKPCSTASGGRMARAKPKYQDGPETPQRAAPGRPRGKPVSGGGMPGSGDPSQFLSDNAKQTLSIETNFTNSPRFPGEWDGLPQEFPAPHPQAVDSLGDHAAQWIETRLQADRHTRMDGLRWWQWLVLQRLLERRADGSWCWPVSFVSVSRQQGKSELLCELAAWRCAHPDLFGGMPQEVGHSASTVVLSRKVQSSRWPWAQAQQLGVARQLGDSQIVWPDGSTWRTMAPENMYGRSLDLILADEAWSWDAENFWQATFPTIAERPGAQAVLWSAAHDSPGSLVGTLFGDPLVAVMWWGARDGEPVEDPGVWRGSSAFFSPRRQELMASAVSKPSFATQWLNRWRRAAGLPWGAALVERLPAPVGLVSWAGALVGGLESEPDGSGWGAAVSDGAGVECVQVPRRDAAVSWLRARGPVRVLCHEAVGRQLAGADDLRLVPVSSTDNAAATAVLRDAVPGLVWAGPLAEQLAGARVATAAGGLEALSAKASDGPVAAVKAAAWVLWSAKVSQTTFWAL